MPRHVIVYCRSFQMPRGQGWRLTSSSRTTTWPISICWLWRPCSRSRLTSLLPRGMRIGGHFTVLQVGRLYLRESYRVLIDQAIHGLPSEQWDGIANKNSSSRASGYCTHGELVFPTWHRVYMAMFEVWSDDHPWYVNVRSALLIFHFSKLL